MPGVAAYGALEARRWAEQAARGRLPGGDAAAARTPTGPTSESVLAHYREVAKAGLPIVAYNNPIDTKVDLTPALLARLYGEGLIVAVKEFSGDVRRIYEIAELAPGPRRAGRLRRRGAGAGRRRRARLDRRLSPTRCRPSAPRCSRRPARATWPPRSRLYRRLHPLLRWDSKPEFVQAIKLAMDLGRAARRPVPAAAAAAAGRAGGRGARWPPRTRCRGLTGRCVSRHVLHAVDSHTEGMPTRVITGGVGVIPGATHGRAAQYFLEHLDHLRTLLMYEPRGHSAMSGAILQPPTRPDADYGVLFIEVSGCLPMCGHGTIGVATVLVETGHGPGDRAGHHRPAGHAGRAGGRRGGGREDGAATAATIRNVPSFPVALDATVDGAGLRRGRATTWPSAATSTPSWSSTRWGCRSSASAGPRLLDAGLAIMDAINEQDGRCTRWTRTINGCHHVYLAAPGSDARHSRHAMAIHPGWFDRSPCGTGTCARMAQLYARGRARRWHQDFVNESYIGTPLHRAAGRGDDGGRPAGGGPDHHRAGLDHRHRPVHARPRGPVPGRLPAVAPDGRRRRHRRRRGRRRLRLFRGPGRPAGRSCWTGAAVAGGTTGAGEGNLLVSDKSPGPELDLTLHSLALWQRLAVHGVPDGAEIELERKGGAGGRGHTRRSRRTGRAGRRPAHGRGRGGRAGGRRAGRLRAAPRSRAGRRGVLPAGRAGAADGWPRRHCCGPRSANTARPSTRASRSPRSSAAPMAGSWPYGRRRRGIRRRRW